MTQLIKSKEGVKYKVKAQWATEDKMRDILKLREHLELKQKVDRAQVKADWSKLCLLLLAKAPH